MQQQVKAQLDASHFTTELPPSRTLMSSCNIILALCSTIYSSTHYYNTSAKQLEVSSSRLLVPAQGAFQLPPGRQAH